MIGYEAGVCWGADISNSEKNYKRGIDCLENEHGRTFEFPDVYMTLDGYSARVIREWYTHIGGMPTRLQASTRYINYDNFNIVCPDSIAKDETAKVIFDDAVKRLRHSIMMLDVMDIPREDIAMLLPLGMETKMVDKRNLRNLIDMSRQRMCKRAYHEYRKMFKDICIALSNYSDEWKYLVEHYFMPKCKAVGFCKEKYSCGMMPKKNEVKTN